MPTVITKTRGKRRYYYAAESKRVNGKPRIVWQKYLGPVEALIAHKEGAEPPKPREAKVFSFGAVAALLGIAQRLDLVELLNRHLPKRSQGPTVGHYLLLAALNRAIAPKSKARIGDWYHETVLQRLWGFKAGAFTSQRFWDHMDRIPVEALQQIEEELVQRVVGRYGIDLRALLYDTTNFFTYVHTVNDRNQVAQRGHNKAKRHDLRQVGMALLVASDGRVPLLHRLYQGNRNDVSQFRHVVDELIRRYRQLGAGSEDLTLVFDKGNNAADLFEHLWRKEVHLVAGLPLHQHPKLLEVPRQQFRPLEDPGLGGLEVYRSRLDLYGRYWTGLVVFSESLFTQQFASITNQLAKCVRQLGWLKQRLGLWRRGQGRGKRPTVASVRNNIAKILAPQHMKQLISTQVEKGKDGLPNLRYSTDHQALQHLMESRLGKNILITDREEWSDAQIVAAAHGQNDIEEVFREMHDTQHLHFRPAFHWTDQKIQVHGFYCVLAWTLVALAQREAQKANLRLSVDRLLSELGKVHEVVHLYPATKTQRPRPHFSLTRLTPTQRKLHKVFGLEAFEVGG